ncbi:MAG: hypothetical protein NUV57_02990 [archaeon]|nr:hypothetical protein [archaeon]
MLCKGKKEYKIKMVEDGKEFFVCGECAKGYGKRNPKPKIERITLD